MRKILILTAYTGLPALVAFLAIRVAQSNLLLHGTIVPVLGPSVLAVDLLWALGMERVRAWALGNSCD